MLLYSLNDAKKIIVKPVFVYFGWAIYNIVVTYSYGTNNYCNKIITIKNIYYPVN